MTTPSWANSPIHKAIRDAGLDKCERTAQVPSHALPCSRLAKCSVCGRITDDHVYYGSLALAETCLMELPHICGSACMADASEKIESGEWKVPVVRLARSGHWDISRPRKGYDAQPDQPALIRDLIHSENAQI